MTRAQSKLHTTIHKALDAIALVAPDAWNEWALNYGHTEQDTAADACIAARDAIGHIQPGSRDESARMVARACAEEGRALAQGYSRDDAWHAMMRGWAGNIEARRKAA